jgi:hypothetical protein
VDSPQAVITAQVEAGVVVRMAVLYELLAGAGAGAGGPRTSSERSRITAGATPVGGGGRA